MSEDISNMVQCGLCGKPINPWMSWYMARRNSKVGTIDGWEYLAIAPLFYACSYQHFLVLQTEHALKMKEIADEALSAINGELLGSPGRMKQEED